MTDRPAPETTPDSFGDLPLQPTGSGVADLEIAYEQMKLTQADPEDAATGARGSDDADATLVAGGDEGNPSEGHPS